MKKLVALLLACMMLPVSMLTAFAAEDIYTVRWVMPGNEPDEMAKVVEAMNQKMEAEGKNFRLEVVRIPWDAWEQRSNLMINTKEDFGLLHIMADQASVMGKDVLVDLKPMLDNYPNLKAKFTENEWAEATNTKGEIVAVPAAWQVFQPLGELSVRTDILAAVGKELPQTPDEVLEAGIAMKAYVEDQLGIKTYYWTQSTNYPAEWLERTYDTYPFYVDRVTNLWKVDQEGNVTSWFESEEFKKDAEFFFRMNEAGLISPDLLNKNEAWEVQNKGTLILGDCYNYGSRQALRDAGFPEADLAFYFLDDAARVLPLTVGNMNGIPKSCTNPEAALAFLDWFYGDPANVQMLVYGIEGVHYTRIEGTENRVEFTKDAIGSQLYYFDNWEVGYYPYNLFSETEPEESIAKITTPLAEGTFVVSPVAGFIFDETPVATEMANLRTEVVASMYPIKFGYVSYEDNIDTAIANLKAAGLDKVLAEYQAQLNAFLGK